MEFAFEAVFEIIMEPVLKFCLFLMTRFSKDNNNINKNKIKGFAVFECIVLILMLIVGIVLLLETNGESAVGRTLIILSVGISVLQIIIGFFMRKNRKL